MINGPDNTEIELLEEIAAEGVELARANDFGERYQRLLEITGTKRPGKPNAEGLVLKALYFQTQADLSLSYYHETNALDEIVKTYNGVHHEVAPAATAPVMLGLVTLLERSTRPVERSFVIKALKASIQQLRVSSQ